MRQNSCAPCSQILQSFGANAVMPSSYPPGADIAGHVRGWSARPRRPAKTAAPTSITITAPRTRSIKLFPPSCVRTPPPWRWMGYALASMKDPTAEIGRIFATAGPSCRSTSALAIKAQRQNSVLPKDRDQRPRACLRRAALEAVS